MEHATSQSEHNVFHNFLSAVLFAIAWIFEGLQSLSGEDIYNIIFRGLSIVSVSIIIVINWPKAKEVLFKKKSKNRKR